MKPSWTYEFFRCWLSEQFPERRIPERGCIAEMKVVFNAHPEVLEKFIADIRAMDGERAEYIFDFAEAGWWPKDSLVEDIRQAPGNRAMAIYHL